MARLDIGEETVERLEKRRQNGGAEVTKSRLAMAGTGWTAAAVMRISMGKAEATRVFGDADNDLERRPGSAPDLMSGPSRND